MTDFPKIAVINTGWSEDYQGAEVRGNFGYLDGKTGHERFNFLPDKTGTYYGFAPPLGKSDSPPMPREDNTEHWLVFFVSKEPGKSGLALVGWYENATFVRGYATRPDADSLELDSDGGKFGYTVSAKIAHHVPHLMRKRRVRGDNLKRSYAYLRGTDDDDAWRGKMAVDLLGFRRELLNEFANIETGDTEVRLSFGADKARRKAIEVAAIEATKEHFFRLGMRKQGVREMWI